jgi:hypothetical protein
MRRLLIYSAAVSLVCIAVVLSTAKLLPPVNAATPVYGEYSLGCSLQAVSGEWGYTYTGTIVGVGPAASVGHFVLDAAGNLKGSQTRSFNGDVENESLTGSVTANADCTGSGTINVYLGGTLERTTDLNVVYVDNEKGLRAIFTSLTPGPVPTVITIDGRKVNTP